MNTPLTQMVPTHIYQAASVEEAVELAQKFKDEGRYDWFRGQVQAWPPLSSLQRIFAAGDAEKEERMRRRIKLFCAWLSQTPELAYLLEPAHQHDFWAVLQHYGIPTHYIDFTTDPGVAGFFAADTRKPQAEAISCIYCLDTGDLLSTWGILKTLDSRNQAEIEPVRIDVRNLWRLKAQQGVFLYANYNWEMDYPMDRIMFPYSGYPSYPTRDRIYPKDKSPLEQLLDQYFAIVGMEETRLEMRQLMGDPVQFESWAEGYNAEAFPDRSHMLPPASWNPEALRAWAIDPEEDFFMATGPTLRLKLSRTADVSALRKQVSFGVRQVLRSEPGIRSKAVNWDFIDLPDSVSAADLNDLFRPAWNGMRRLPYADADIAEAFANILVLLAAEFGRSADVSQEEGRFTRCFGESLYLEFGHKDFSSSRGFAARQSLVQALRPDMQELLSPEYQGLTADLEQLLQVIYNPSLMFEFEPFKRLFAQEVIPAQVLLRRSPILFNPVRLSTFGIP